MNSSVAVLLPRRASRQPAGEATRARWVRRRIGIIWGLLVLNVLTFSPGMSVVPIPSFAGKAVTQGALSVALLMALTVNRRVLVRPNVFLFLVTLLVVETILTSLQPQFLGTVYRTFRFAEFVATLWLLSPWWGRRDLFLVRCHIRAMATVLGSVLLGLLVAPGKALNGGRLGGAIWPIPATQVAHYAAVLIGLVVVLWLCGLTTGRISLLAVVVAGTILVLTHTRTALVAMAAGILISGLSLIVAKARVRKLFAALAAVTAIAVITTSGVFTTWLARGQGTEQLTNLSGRTPVWTAVLSYPRSRFQEIFGFGLSNSSFNGLPIDSNWIAAYQQQGLYGVIICAITALFLILTSYFKPRGAERALALFLIIYCLLASLTETGFSDATTYLLDLAVAASLLAPTAAKREPTLLRTGSVGSS